MMERTVYKEPLAYLIGSPRVVVERSKREAQVYIENAPWGLGSCLLQFLNPESPGVERYAQKLLLRIRMIAEREAARRDRIKFGQGRTGGSA